MNKYIVPLLISLLLLSTSFTGVSRKKAELITGESLIDEVGFDDVVDQEQPIRDSLHGSIAEVEWAQSFKPSLTTLTRVELLIQADASIDVNLTISIRDSLEGNDLTNITVYSDDLPFLDDWYMFDVPDINVTPEETYFIVFSHDWCTNGGISWGYSHTDTYPRGMKYMEIPYPDNDWTFRTYGFPNGPMDSAWPMFQHDAANTGFSSSPFPDSLNLSYNFTYSEIINSTFCSFDSSPIVANGKIFIAGGGWTFDTDIIALDENDGSLIWETDLPLNYSSTPFIVVNSPVISNEKVFVCYASLFSFPPQSRIFALDENTGELIWENHFFTSSGHSSLTISNDVVIAGGSFTNILPISRLYAFDANNGDLIWHKTMLGYFESTPAVSNNIVFTATSCKSAMTIGLNAPLFSGRSRVYAFDLNNGSKIWETRVKGHVILSSPTVSNGKLLVPSTIIRGLFTWNRRVTSLDVKTGEEIWYYHIRQNVLNACWPASISTPSVGYGKIFVNDATGFIIALDEETGEMLWGSEIIDELVGGSMCSAKPPVIADYKVITSSSDLFSTSEINEICMFNVSNGEKIWSVEFDDGFDIMTPFAIANGKLFVNTNNSIYVYS